MITRGATGGSSARAGGTRADKPPVAPQNITANLGRVPTAAVAPELGLPLYTPNAKHFSMILGLTVLRLY